MMTNAGREPLTIASQGYFFVGGQYKSSGAQRVMHGQMYVEYQIPSDVRAPCPIVMIHGGGQSGTNWTGTPDGREGWAQYFLRRGWPVYVVDTVGRARSAGTCSAYGEMNEPNLDFIQDRFLAPERAMKWPQAALHTQFPGEARPGDEIFDQFVASQVSSIADYPLQQALNGEAGAALLDRIGPAVVMTHSQAGPFGWLTADRRPRLVRAIVAVEPNGPPVHDVDFLGAPDWFSDNPTVKGGGICHAALTYEPPLAPGEQLAFVCEKDPRGPGLVRCWRQAEPARKLVNLAGIPILILAGEASYHAPYDHCTSEYLTQAGVANTFIRLADRGIHGNGHMMMIEKNNMAIADVIAEWLDQTFS
ncbi:MAG: alpha/beta hydrolase [Hyphomicrobiaceae bacterium]